METHGENPVGGRGIDLSARCENGDRSRVFAVLICLPRKFAGFHHKGQGKLCSVDKFRYA